MKKVFALVIGLTLIFFGIQAFAQSPCDQYPQNSPEWQACMSGIDNTGGIPGQTGATPPPSGQLPDITVNGNNPNTTIFSTPQSGSQSLSACNNIKFKSLLDILIWLRCIIVQAVIPLVLTAAFLFFLWGVMRFMLANDNKVKKDEAKRYIWWGLVALFVMVGVWGIVKIATNTLGIEAGVPLLQTEYLDPNKAN